MPKTVSEVITEVLRRLSDAEELVWTSNEIHDYLKDGYRRLAQTGCFWDMIYLEDQAYTGNYTKDAERALASSGFNFFNKFAYTKEADAEFCKPGQAHLGPANHTKKSEYDNDHVTTVYFLAVHDLPEELLEIERAVWNQVRIDPLRSVELEHGDSQFQTQTGEVQGYVQDKDGIKKFRKWRIPSQKADAYTITGTWGGLRKPSDISAETVHGSWGIARRLPGMHPCSSSSPWGTPRRPWKAAHNTKIEYSRKGHAIDFLTDEFECQDRQVKYLRHFAMSRALERNGPGQDLKLAAFWRARWDAGIERLKRRMRTALARKMIQLGGERARGTRPPLAKLPWNYGYPVR